jgi:hypothetical protein
VYSVNVKVRLYRKIMAVMWRIDVEAQARWRDLKAEL